MLTRESILEAELTENRLHERINTTCAKRAESKSAWNEWEAATDAWHNQRYPTDKLWEDGFLADLRASKRLAIEEAILYLEVDPWYYRSGYLKVRLIRGLKAATLTDYDRKRLSCVIWCVAGGRNRREYRNYCSLAARIGNADLVRMLEEISPEQDKAAKGKFGYLLSYLRQHKKQGESVLGIK